MQSQGFVALLGGAIKLGYKANFLKFAPTSKRCLPENVTFVNFKQVLHSHRSVWGSKTSLKQVKCTCQGILSGFRSVLNLCKTNSIERSLKPVDIVQTFFD